MLIICTVQAIRSREGLKVIFYQIFDSSDVQPIEVTGGHLEATNVLMCLFCINKQAVALEKWFGSWSWWSSQVVWHSSWGAAPREGFGGEINAWSFYWYYSINTRFLLDFCVLFCSYKRAVSELYRHALFSYFHLHSDITIVHNMCVLIIRTNPSPVCAHYNATIIFASICFSVDQLYT